MREMGDFTCLRHLFTSSRNRNYLSARPVFIYLLVLGNHIIYWASKKTFPFFLYTHHIKYFLDIQYVDHIIYFRLCILYKMYVCMFTFCFYLKCTEILWGIFCLIVLLFSRKPLGKKHFLMY